MYSKSLQVFAKTCKSFRLLSLAPRLGTPHKVPTFPRDFCVSPGLKKVATFAYAPGAAAGRSYGIRQIGSMFGARHVIPIASTLAQPLGRRGSVLPCSGRAQEAFRRAPGGRMGQKSAFQAALAPPRGDFSATFAGAGPRLSTRLLRGGPATLWGVPRLTHTQKLHRPPLFTCQNCPAQCPQIQFLTTLCEYGS